MSDLGPALRRLWRSPGFTAVAVATLALGIGANTAIWSVVRGVLLRPLSYPDPERLVALWEASPERGVARQRVSGPTFLDWRAQSTVFERMAASPDWEGGGGFNLVLGDQTVAVAGAYVSSSLFATLGVAPLLGRPLAPDEDAFEGPRSMVLGHALWQRAFGGDPAVLGRSLTVDSYGRRDYTVVGVMPPGFAEPGAAELWLPQGWMGVRLDQRRPGHWYRVVARLHSGVTLEQARAELSAIQSRVAAAHPGEGVGTAVVVTPLAEETVGPELRSALLVAWAAVGAVLLLACANVASLMLARATVRRGEMAVRRSLGASRWALVRPLLLESLALALLGGGLGLLVGRALLSALIAAAPAGLPRLDGVVLDSAALVFTLAVSLLAGLSFGLAPAWRGSRADPRDALAEGGRSASPAGAAVRVRDLLVLAEVAVAVVLLVGAGLLLQSLGRMLRADRGFDPRRLTAVTLDFSVSGFASWLEPVATRPQVALHDLLERVRSLPGVEEVGAASRLPRRERRPPQQPFVVYGRPLDPAGEGTVRAELTGVSPGWRRAMGVRLLAGRDLAETDALDSARAVLVSESFARAAFAGEDPVGSYLALGDGRAPLDGTDGRGHPVWSEIVGVVSDLGSLEARPEVVPEVFASYWQHPMQQPTLVVRASGDPGALAAAIRRELRARVPGVPAPTIRTVDELLGESAARPRFTAVVTGSFAVTALLLAAVGVAGVLGIGVAERRRELGVRLALGALRSDLLVMVMARGTKLMLLGAGLGIPVAVALARVLERLLYGVGPSDPFTLAAVVLLVLAVALAASLVPALRAAGADPTAALRAE